MDFHGIDLNLLAAFLALDEERNVTRAAARAGVSQPAMSAALARLRTVFDDPLFLRGAEGLLPTPGARELAGPVRQALQQIESALVQATTFDPAVSSFSFTLGLAEYPTFIFLPLLARALAAAGPGLSLAVHTIGHKDRAVDLLDSGIIDAAIGAAPTHGESRILTQPLLREEFVSIVRRGHPATQHGLDFDTFMNLPHLLVSPEGDQHGMVDKALDQLGKRRLLTLTLPTMFAAPAVVAATDLLATVMKRVALRAAVRDQLDIFTPPVLLPEMIFNLMWHRRNNTHPAQRWFRQHIVALAAQSAATPDGEIQAAP